MRSKIKNAFAKNRAGVVVAVVAASALVLGGGTAAVAHGMIGEDDLRNRAVTKTKIAQDAVNPYQLSPRAVRKNHVRRDAIGFAEIRKNSVGWHNEINQSTRNKIKRLAGKDGARGPAGPKGGQGPKGDKGDKGDDGISGVVIPTEKFNADNPKNGDTFGVYCPEGKSAIGGGYDTAGGATVTADKPWWGTFGSGKESNDPDRAAGWNAEGQLNGGEITVWAICAALN